jgi:peptidoglycan/xylan/chitin deacetylase (PgdA/CDA1 family)
MNLLEVLDRYGVKATFFMIGRYVNARPEIAATVARAGHVIGNHTFTHPNLIFCSRTQIRAQLADCDSALCDSVGEHSRLFRPPFGGRRPAVLKVANELELSTIMWDVTAYDWRLGQASRIEEHVFRQVRGGNVILLHDGSHLSLGVDRSQTVEATSAIIRRYHDLGFAFVTIPEMMDRVTASHQSPVAG